MTRSGYLSVTRHLPGEEAATYAAVWHSKGTVARVLQRRRRALAGEDLPEARELRQTRQALARLLLEPPDTRPRQAERARALALRKEQLEKKLAARLPAQKVRPEAARRSPAELQKRLPPGVVFIDLVRYVWIEWDPKHPGQQHARGVPSYVAFVLAAGQPLRRVELGEAAPLDKAVADWRRALTDGRPGGEAVAVLGRTLWGPLAKALPTGTHTALLSPDAHLTAVPWAALPGTRPGTVLLEDHAVAVVPNGPFLLEALEAAPAEGGILLAVGGVEYGKPRPAPEAEAKADVPTPGLSWPALPATARELEQVVGLAGERPVLSLKGTKAGAPQLLTDLPKARWAHLATHGFFADKKFRSLLRLDEGNYWQEGSGERVGVGARNPLVLSGLVVAGANLPADANPDGGIVTAEAIASLDLDRLELAVLSACDTGLGEVAGGEGVFGLQRAFHLAGARNVVASLWKVEDEATAALMGLFYHHLWREKRPPLEALRQAQLTLYRHPERIPALAQERGLEFSRVARQPAPPTSAARAPARLWAGFVLSGLGR
jgi:CHAT domain-containing protein